MATTRKNPGWKLEQSTIDIVAAARGVLNKTNAEVIEYWAQQWQDQQQAAREGTTQNYAGEVKWISPEQAAASPEVKAVVHVDKPVATRVETPYQLERRMRVEALRAQMEAGDGTVPAQQAAPKVISADSPVLPFEVMVGGQKHRVREFHGRSVLEWIGPTSTVMKKNLTPQETVIYWGQRLK